MVDLDFSRLTSTATTGGSTNDIVSEFVALVYSVLPEGCAVRMDEDGNFRDLIMADGSLISVSLSACRADLERIDSRLDVYGGYTRSLVRQWLHTAAGLL